ncbi:MAG: hypothetical protein IKV24_02110 [Bacteroidaceae bacterium]|nr:hypothetical protein [Bacteroidaceae bacterium]
MNRWIRRKRNSHGYGVQSPNDFFFVQHVLRGQSSYYAYAELHQLYQAAKASCPDISLYGEEVYRLLFRVTDYVHPEVIIEVGTRTGLAACSMALARPMGHCAAIGAESMSVLPIPSHLTLRKGDEMALFSEELQRIGSIECLHVAHTPHYREVVEMALPRVCDKSLFIIDGIRDNAAKRTWWRNLKESPLTGVCYDLGTIGLIFFDKSRYKDTYWINIKKRRFLRRL